MFGRITVRIPLTFLVSSELRQSASEDICLKVLQDLFSEAPFLSFFTVSLKFVGLWVLHLQWGVKGECSAPRATCCFAVTSWAKKQSEG